MSCDICEVRRRLSARIISPKFTQSSLLTFRAELQSPCCTEVDERRLSEADCFGREGGTAEDSYIVWGQSKDTHRVRPERKLLIFSGCNSFPATESLQSVAIEATRGGNETVGAFETDGSLGDSASRHDRP